MMDRRRRVIRSLAAAGLVYLAFVPAPASGADPLTIEWVSTSPFTAYADGISAVDARPTFVVINGTDEQLSNQVTMTLDPPEVIGPEDPPFAYCESPWPVAGSSLTGFCNVPIRADQVAAGAIIRAQLTVTATTADGTVLNAKTGVLEIIGVPSAASLSLVIDPLPEPIVVVTPGDLTIGYDVTNDGTVDIDDATAEVRVSINRAGSPSRGSECPADVGPLVVGQSRHETCTAHFDPDEVARGGATVEAVVDGRAGDLTTRASDTVTVRVVTAGPRLEVDMLEIGLNDTKPAPGDTFALQVQLYNLGSVPLDVTTWTDPVSPDCARSIGSIGVPEGFAFECQFLVPVDEATCVMSYSVFARGSAADAATADARIDSRASLTQPEGCGSGGGGSGEIAIPPTDTVQPVEPPGRAPVDAAAILVAVALTTMSLTIWGSGRARGVG
jgi:hypothetical protein